LKRFYFNRTVIK